METNRGQWAVALLHSEREPEQYPCKDYKEVLSRAEKFMKSNQPKEGERIGVITGIISGHGADADGFNQSVQSWIADFASY